MTSLVIMGLLLAGEATAADTWDTSDTAADTADTESDTDVTDSESDNEEWVSGSPATELAGDEGGFSCSVGPAGAPLLVALPLLALARRREREAE